MAGELPTFIAEKLPDLLHELPLSLPRELPDYGSASDETLCKIVSDGVRRLNPLYEDPRDMDTAGPRPLVDGPALPATLKGSRVLQAGTSAIQVASRVGFFDVAPDDYPADWRYIQSDKVLMSYPTPELGDMASVAVCLSAMSSREAPDSSAVTYKLGSAWELRIPNVPALRAFGMKDEDVVSEVPSAKGSIVEQYFPGDSQKIVTDLPLIREDDAGRGWKVAEHRLGIIAGHYLEDSIRNRVLGIGATILGAADPTLFQAV